MRLKKLLNTSAVVFASHDKKLVESICNRIIILEKGKIIKDKKKLIIILLLYV